MDSESQLHGGKDKDGYYEIEDFQIWKAYAVEFYSHRWF